MPPNLGKIPIQTLTCGALIIGGAVVSGIVGGATLTVAIGTSLLSLVSGLATEVAGNDVVELAQQFRPSVEVLRNHDLAKAVGIAITVVIKHAATNPEFQNHKKELDKLAQKAVKYYLTIAKEDADKVFAGIQEEQLPAIFLSRAEEFSQVKALDSERWELLLDWLKGKEELVILPNPVIRHIANELHNTFPQALREVLKEDAARDGKAFSGIMLLLLGEIAADLRNLRSELSQRCDRILEEVQRLKAMPTDASEVTQVFQQLLAQVQSGLSEELKAIAQQLVGIEAKVDQLQNTATQTLDTTEEIKKRLEQLTPQRLIAVSGIIDSTRPSLNNWQGRQEEIEQIQEWLDAQNVNLIGIVAAGGYGKSTLAAKIYEENPAFTNKFWVNVSQPLNFNLLERELLKLLGYEADERMSDSQLAGELVTHLRDDGQYLLALDNLESLLQPNGQWRDAAYQEFFNCWLSYGDRSVILVTTQEKPDLPEQNARWRRLDGLKPAEGAALLKEQGIQGSETELLDFAEQVEGHPLLLNLVIGFLRAEEGDNPPLSALRRGNINFFEVIGLHRGQPNISVGKVFDTSFDRLDDRLQTLLLNVSVYRLPFNALAAAVMLPAGEGEQDTDTIKQVERDLRQLLVRRSLLQEQRDATGKRRFRFQPLILDYVRQKAGDRAEAHERAINYYRSKTTDKSTWKALEDLAPYLEIFYHYYEQKQYAQAFDTLNICDEFLDLRGYNAIRVELYEQLVQVWEPSEAEQKRKLAVALNRLGIEYHHLVQFSKTIEYCQQALKIGHDVGDHRSEALALLWLGNAYRRLDQPHRALEFNRQALEVAQEINDSEGQSASLLDLGDGYVVLKQYQQAIEFYLQGLEVSRAINHRRLESNSLVCLGRAYHSLGQYQQAIKFYQQGLEVSRAINHRRREANALNYLGIAYHSMGQYQQAIDYYQRSVKIKREFDDRRGEVVSISWLVYDHYCLGQYHQAIDYYQQLAELKRKMGALEGEVNALELLINPYLYLGEDERIAECYQQLRKLEREMSEHQG